MGRQASGRPNATSSLRLDLAKMMRGGHFVPGMMLRSSITWSSPYSGEWIVTAALECEMIDPTHGSVRLRHMAYTAPGLPAAAQDYRVQLTTTAQHLGGQRWWFVCPHTGHLARVLFLPMGGSIFASRTAYQLPYACQGETPADRAMRRARKARARLGITDPNLCGAIPMPKPLRMRETTYRRLRLEALEAQAAVWGNALAWVDRFKGRNGLL